MNRVLRTTLILLGAAAPALAAAPQSAIVQAGGGQDSPSGNWTVVVSDAKGECKVECQDGAVKASVNGEEVPADQVVRSGGQILIHGADGQVVRQMQDPENGQDGASVFTWNGSNFEPMELQWGQLGAQLGQMDELSALVPGQYGLALGGMEDKRPRIGVSMEPLGEALAAQVGVEQDQAVVLTEVIENMPAAEAGVKKYDVVVAIDGQSPVTEDSLREAVSGKQDGETITLKIVRHGEKLEIPVRVRMVETDEAAPLAQSLMQGQGQMQMDPNTLDGLLKMRADGMASGADQYKHALEALQQAQENLGQQMKQQQDGNTWRGAMEQAMKSIEEAQSNLREQLQQHQLHGWPGQRLRVPDGDNDVWLFSTPTPPTPPSPATPPSPPAAPGYGGGRMSGGLEDRIRGLEERLARIESMLERLSNG